MMKTRNMGYTTRLLSCLLVCGALTLTACSTSMKAPVLDRVAKAGELRVGTSGNMPPLNVMTKGGQIIGLEADLARIIAGAMGVNLELVPMPFAELLPALEMTTLLVLAVVSWRRIVNLPVLMPRTPTS